MVVVYAARHCALLMFSTRGVKLESEMVAEVPVVRIAKLSAMERSVICIVACGYYDVLGGPICMCGLSLDGVVKEGAFKGGPEYGCLVMLRSVQPRVEFER
jgi:hypothetical protein